MLLWQIKPSFSTEALFLVAKHFKYSPSKHKKPFKNCENVKFNQASKVLSFILLWEDFGRHQKDTEVWPPCLNSEGWCWWVKKVPESDHVHRDECAEDSYTAGSWKCHHILGVSLTQTDITQWKPLDFQSDTGLLCWSTWALSKNHQIVWKVGDWSLKKKRGLLHDHATAMT